MPKEMCFSVTDSYIIARKYLIIWRRHSRQREPYKPSGFDGGAGRDRTDDLNTASVALSQLSYGPMIFVLSRIRPTEYKITNVQSLKASSYL